MATQYAEYVNVEEMDVSYDRERDCYVAICPYCREHVTIRGEAMCSCGFHWRIVIEATGERFRSRKQGVTP